MLKGSIDEVRSASRFSGALPIKGVQIIGKGHPHNPSCAFLEKIKNLRYLRLFPAELTEIEAIQNLSQLRHLSITHVKDRQSIAVDIAKFQFLESVEISWFNGAETTFGSQ